MTPPRRNTANAPDGGASSLISRRLPFLVCISCLLLVEFTWRARVGTPTNASPCETKYVNTNNDLGKSNATELDFATLGFPKTGTTFLIYALEQHPQVVMPPDGTAPYEFCHIHHPNGHKELRDWLQNASSTESTKQNIPSNVLQW
jgi:hypothetical protein